MKTNLSVRLVIFVVMSIAFISCGNFENKKIVEQFDLMSPNSSFCLDTINRASWDTLYIVMPYQKFSEKGIDISRDLRQQLSLIEKTDNHSLLIFVKGDALVNYSVVPRNVLDFSFVKELKKVPANYVYQIDSVRRVR